MLFPIQIATSDPAKAVGKEFTIIVISSVAVHPGPLDTVTIYVVVIAGLAKGFEIFVALNPAEGLHK